MRRRLCAVSLAALMVGVFGAMPAAQGETLRDALSKAYATNPRIKAAQAQLRATDETVPQALSNWRPVVSLSGDVSKSHRESQTATTNVTPWGYGLTVSQPLYRGGRTEAATRRAEYLIQADRSNLNVVEQQVLLDAVTAYVDVLRDQAVLDLNMSNVRVLERQLQATQDRFQVGEVTRTDVAQAESRLESAKADQTQAEGNLTASMAVYRNVFGEAPTGLLPPQPDNALPSTEQEASSFAQARNPNVRRATSIELAAREQIRLIAGEFLPTVSLVGDISDDRDSQFSGQRTQSETIGARVTVPLYQAGSVSSRVREAKQIAAQRREELDTSRRAAVASAATSWEGLQTARARLQSLSATIRAAEIALEGVRQESLVGSRTVLDVLNAEQELLNARVSFARSQRDEVVARYQLLSSVGSLTAEALNLPVQIYDVQRNYEYVHDKWWGTAIPEQPQP